MTAGADAGYAPGAREPDADGPFEGDGRAPFALVPDNGRSKGWNSLTGLLSPGPNA